MLVDGDLIASRQKASLFSRLMGGHGFPDENLTVAAIRDRVGAGTPTTR